MNPAIIVGHPPQCCSPQHVTQLCQLHEVCMATGACSCAHICAYASSVVSVGCIHVHEVGAKRWCAVLTALTSGPPCFDRDRKGGHLHRQVLSLHRPGPQQMELTPVS